MTAPPRGYPPKEVAAPLPSRTATTTNNRGVHSSAPGPDEAEVVTPISRADAERLDKRIRLLVNQISDTFNKLYELVEQAKTGEIHKALNYPSWTAYVTDVFTVTIRLDRPQRRELVGYLSGEGMSQRGIADVVGVSKNTVTADLKVSQIGTPEPHHPMFNDAAERAEIMAMADVPEDEFEEVLVQARTQGDVSRGSVARLCSERTAKKIVGRDGKQYPSTPPAPVKPRRQPLGDAFHAAEFSLRKITDRLWRLVDDDRFDRNREAIAEIKLSDLIRSRDKLNRVIEMLGGGA